MADREGADLDGSGIQNQDILYEEKNLFSIKLGKGMLVFEINSNRELTYLVTLQSWLLVAFQCSLSH